MAITFSFFFFFQKIHHHQIPKEESSCPLLTRVDVCRLNSLCGRLKAHKSVSSDHLKQVSKDLFRGRAQRGRCVETTPSPTSGPEQLPLCLHYSLKFNTAYAAPTGVAHRVFHWLKDPMESGIWFLLPFPEPQRRERFLRCCVSSRFLKL